jgi:uncharacterized protein YciI
MKHFILFYDYVADAATKRVPLRAAHLAHAQGAKARGDLVLGGALAEPLDGAVLVFKGETKDVAEAFAKADPYVQGGLVTGWRVREWTTVIGEGALTPIPKAAGLPA